MIALHELASARLESWANFYVIVGSSAGAMTGLQFVVLTLVAQGSSNPAREETLAAFGSPNVVHFCAALLVAAIVSAPWHTMAQLVLPMVLCGVGGVLYSAMVFLRARRQRGYQPVLEDWIWHNILPTLAYSAILVAGALLASRSAGPLFVIAGATLLLVFIGIHNAWDTITYLTVQRGQRAAASRSADAATSRSSPEDPRRASPEARS